MTTYEVGIIGTGFGAKVQAPALQADNRFHVRTIAGTREEKTKNTAESLGIDKYTINWKDLLSEELDLIIVSTPPYLHYPMAKAVLEANINLLLEKPTTSNAFEAKKLYRMAEDRDLVGMLSHEFRWVPERAFLKKLLDDKTIGKVREIYLHQFMNFGASSSIKEFGWFWNSLYEGGIIGALGSHLFDWIRYITGEEFQTIQGNLQTIVKNKIDQNGITHKVTADTGFNFNYSMSNDIFGNFSASSTIHHPPPAKLIIGGDEGTIILENGISLAKEGESLTEMNIPDEFGLDMSQAEKDHRIPPYMKLLDQLASSLDRGVSLSPSLYDGWKNQQVIDAVKQSHETGNTVNIVD